MTHVADFIGRLLIAMMFFLAGLNKISGYDGTIAYMKSADLPGELLPLVIALEIIGPVLLVIGWQIRLAALVLAAFSVLTAYFFHSNFADQMQVILFMKNFAIAGGLLIIAGRGPGSWSMGR